MIRAAQPSSSPINSSSDVCHKVRDHNVRNTQRSWLSGQLAMMSMQILCVQVVMQEFLPPRKEVHMRRVVRSQQEKSLSVVLSGLVHRDSSFDHLLREFALCFG